MQFLKPGDSGSTLVEERRRLIGLLFAGGADPVNGGICIANPIVSVLRELDVSLCTQWVSEGGVLTSNVAVTRNDDGRLYFASREARPTRARTGSISQTWLAQSPVVGSSSA